MNEALRTAHSPTAPEELRRQALQVSQKKPRYGIYVKSGERSK